MKTSNPFFFAAWKMRSMFSTVLFSLTLSPTAPHAMPFSLKTSFCGSMNTSAVSFLLIFMVYLLLSYAARAITIADPLMNASRSSLTKSLSVVHMPCGAPG